MGSRALAAVAMTATSVLAAGCSGTGSASTAALPTATVSAGASRSTPASARLTIAQARTRYRTISAPFNAAVAVVNQDAQEGTTWTKFKADVLAVVAADKIWTRQVQAVRWPLVVQPYVNVMVKTGVPAEISCDQAMAAAGNLQGAAAVFSNDSTCKGTAATVDKIRTILNLPPAPG